MIMKKIYIAGPYTSDPIKNVSKAIDVAEELFNKGYAPFIPHLAHLWEAIYPKKYEDWIEYNYNWFMCCDAVLRFPGDSPGADTEVGWAKINGIPVFYSIEELKGWGKCIGY